MHCACIALPRRVQVLGLERYGIGHANASHHGLTRITRLAYMEGPEYVPLLHKSFACYETLERESRTKLYTRTGVLNMGRSASTAARVC